VRVLPRPAGKGTSGFAAVSVRASHAESHDYLGHVLHEEIDRLPERFRVSVVLCDLEGRTHEQAARHLKQGSSPATKWRRSRSSC